MWIGSRTVKFTRDNVNKSDNDDDDNNDDNEDKLVG